MNPHRRVVTWSVVVPAIVALLVAACAPGARPAPTGAGGSAPAGAAPSAPAPQQSAASVPAPSTQSGIRPEFQEAMQLSIDDLYQKALAEGGILTYYGTLAQINAEKILPAFEARFPGIKVTHVDATSDKLATRIVAEARGGRVLADFYEAQLTDAVNLNKQGVLLHALPPEADEYPDGFKGPYWLAIGTTYLIVAWNTNLVSAAEAPRSLEDVADPRWKGRIIAEPRDVEMLIGMAHKYGSEERALDWLRRIAANEPEFHTGHSELAELLTAGHAAICLGCYSHHFPTRLRRGAPLDYLLVEGVAQNTAATVLKDAPHPYTAMLWHRFMHNEEGQNIYADGGRTPAHPNVPPRDRTRPDRLYAVTAEDVEQMARYERLWKETFQIR